MPKSFFEERQKAKKEDVVTDKGVSKMIDSTREWLKKSQESSNELDRRDIYFNKGFDLRDILISLGMEWEEAERKAFDLLGEYDDKKDYTKVNVRDYIKKQSAPQMIDEAIQEVEQVTKKKGKREKKPVKTSFEPHDYHKGPWSKIELIEFYKKHGYVPPLKNGNPRNTNIEKLMAEQEKKIKKTTQVSKSGKLSIQFPGPWRKHTGTWKPQEMYDYYKEWGVIPPTKQGKERAITLIDLEYKIKGIKRPKTQGLMKTKATVVKKKEEPKMTEEPVRDLRKLRAMITELYDDLRSEMTEDEKMRYTRLFKEQHFDDVYKFMKQMEKKYY